MSNAVHLYGVTRADAPEPSGEGRQGAPVRRVADDVLAVVVSDVDVEQQVGAADLLAHAHVLEQYVEQATVLPMRFGIMLPDDDTVREQVLRQDRDRNLRLLSRFDGYVQVTAQVFHDEEPALREVLARDPELRALQEASRGRPEQAQLQLGEAVARAMENLAAEDAQLVVDRLSPHAEAVAVNSAQGMHEVLHAAFLVRRDARAHLDEAVAKTRDEVAHRMRIRYVGPQPPYSFLEQAQEPQWA